MSETKEKYAVALGVFDGVHIGHKEVIGMALNEENLRKGIFTFKTETIPQKNGKTLEYIYTTDYKEKIFSRMNIDKVCCADYSEIKDMDGETFCRKYLCEFFNAKKVFCGKDFRFGKNAAWNVDDLKKFGEKYGFEVRAIDPVKSSYDPDRKISSTDIREALQNGDIEKANKFLADDYKISGKVVHGRKIGRTIDFPTINQYFFNGQIIPKFGVYSSFVKIESKTYKSVTNIGVKPTVSNENKVTAETYIIDFSGDLYGIDIEVSLKKFIRPEMKFDSIEELKKQIENDIKSCRK